VSEHKQGLIEGFTKKYRVTRLVYVEQFDRPAEMVARERQLKGWTRSRRLELIHSQNPEMVDYIYLCVARGHGESRGPGSIRQVRAPEISLAPRHRPDSLFFARF
jgi:hypothetical protein